MGHPAAHFEIISQDQRLLNDVYGSVFDWEIEQVMEGRATVTTDSGIAGGIGSMVQTRRHVIFYVEVTDIHAALALIESKAGKLGFCAPPLPTGAIVAGSTHPDGNLVGLMHQPAQILNSGRPNPGICVKFSRAWLNSKEAVLHPPVEASSPVPFPFPNRRSPAECAPASCPSPSA